MDPVIQVNDNGAMIFVCGNHRREECHVCCMSFKMPNDDLRTQARMKLGLKPNGTRLGAGLLPAGTLIACYGQNWSKEERMKRKLFCRGIIRGLSPLWEDGECNDPNDLCCYVVEPVEQPDNELMQVEIDEAHANWSVLVSAEKMLSK